MPKVNWLWLVIGIVLALFVFPFIQGKLVARKNGPTATRTA